LEDGYWPVGRLEERKMKPVHELDVYVLAEEFSDMVWNNYDSWSEKVKKTIGYQIIRSADSIAANLAGSAP